MAILGQSMAILGQSMAILGQFMAILDITQRERDPLGVSKGGTPATNIPE